MSETIINISVEDVLSKSVAETMLKQSTRDFTLGVCYQRNGFGYLKKTVPGLNIAAQRNAYLVLTDLDQNSCPLEIISKWLPQPKHSNLIFRIAVREIESWVLADREQFAKFLGISLDLIPPNVDKISDPKEFLINLARKSKKKELRDSIVPPAKSTAKVGRDYNGQLMSFVNNHWQARLALENSPSLARAMKSLDRFVIT